MDNFELSQWIANLKDEIGRQYPGLYHYAEVLDKVHCYDTNEEAYEKECIELKDIENLTPIGTWQRQPILQIYNGEEYDSGVYVWHYDLKNFYSLEVMKSSYCALKEYLGEKCKIVAVPITNDFEYMDKATLVNFKEYINDMIDEALKG